MPSFELSPYFDSIAQKFWLQYLFVSRVPDEVDEIIEARKEDRRFETPNGTFSVSDVYALNREKKQGFVRYLLSNKLLDSTRFITLFWWQEILLSFVWQFRPSNLTPEQIAYFNGIDSKFKLAPKPEQVH